MSVWQVETNIYRRGHEARRIEIEFGSSKKEQSLCTYITINESGGSTVIKQHFENARLWLTKSRTSAIIV